MLITHLPTPPAKTFRPYTTLFRSQQQHSGQHIVGQKQYELTNHLGNVQVTVSDLPYKHGNDTITRISPALKAVYDYYPLDRKSTRLNSSHVASSYAVVC